VALGVKKGERVALVVPNSPQAILAQIGTWKAGAIVAPLNALYTERELEYSLNEIGAETVVVLTPFYAKIKAIQPRTQVRRVIATNIKEYLPPATRLLFTLALEKKEGHRVSLQAGDYWLGDLLRQHRTLPGRRWGSGPRIPPFSCSAAAPRAHPRRRWVPTTHS
jgi:long-chain acyl-CoA synthetase